jgi:hypothetical protein
VDEEPPPEAAAVHLPPPTRPESCVTTAGVVVERTAHAGSENVCTTCFTYDPVGARIQFLLTLPPPALGRQAPLVKTCCDTYGPMQEELDAYVVTVLKYCSAHVSGQNVGESVGESVGDNVGASVGAAVGESVGDAEGDNTAAVPVNAMYSNATLPSS